MLSSNPQSFYMIYLSFSINTSRLFTLALNIERCSFAGQCHFKVSTSGSNQLPYQLFYFPNENLLKKCPIEHFIQSLEPRIWELIKNILAKGLNPNKGVGDLDDILNNMCHRPTLGSILTFGLDDYRILNCMSQLHLPI